MSKTSEEVCGESILAIATELRERCAYYERTNVLQGGMLNECINERDKLTMVLAERTVERDEYREALEMITKMAGQYASQALSKYPREEKP